MYLHLLEICGYSEWLVSVEASNVFLFLYIVVAFQRIHGKYPWEELHVCKPSLVLNLLKNLIKCII